jgi:threonine dehydratase
MKKDLTISLENVQETAALIQSHVVRTPVVEWWGPEINALIPADTSIFAKLELFQRSGTFKARGAISNILRLSREQHRCGITAMSAGNHAIAAAYAAAACEISAKVVMQATANPARVALARAYGAEVVIAEDGPTGFAMAQQIAESEGRYFIHPFDGPETALGTATIGLELHQQLGDHDVLIVAIGGGGLAGGLSAMTKILNPNCYIIGVEPEGANSMYKSFQSGKAENIGVPETIADSLAPPMTLPYPFELCHRNIDRLMLVSDTEIAAAMRLIFREMKLAVEPACAAATAAMLQVVNEFPGARIGVIFCGSNIDMESYQDNCKIGSDD